jgi:uncharacterized protein (PEP-CTERM system associated)
LTLSVFRNTDDYESIDRSDEGTGVSLGSSAQLSQRLTGNLLASYTHYRFLPQDEESDRVGVGLSFAYETNVTTVSFGYTHNLTDSTTAGNSFMSNIVWARAGFTF